MIIYWQNSLGSLLNEKILLSQTTSVQGAGMSTCKGPLQINILPATTLFWRLTEFNGMDTDHFMPAGLAVRDEVSACLADWLD